MRFDKDNRSLVGCGKNDVYFIQEGTDGMKLIQATGWSSTKSERQPCLCIGFIRYDVLVGTQSGDLLIFKGLNLFRAMSAHDGPVNTIWTRNNDAGIISGGSDGKVIVWNSDMIKQYEIDISSISKKYRILDIKVRSVTENHQATRLCIGTRSSNIIEVEYSSDNNHKYNCLMSGHFGGELWGLCTIPNTSMIITCGEDFVVSKWDLVKRQLVKCKKIVNKAVVCDVSQDGKYVAIGCLNGQTIILDVEKLEEVYKFRDRSKEISCVKFSPDCKVIAIAGADTRINFYSCDNNFDQISESRDHRYNVTHMDWSLDSKIVQTNSSGFEMLYIIAETGNQNAKGLIEYKDEEWYTWNSLLGWQVLGIWPATSEGYDINATSRTKSKQVIATADDFGKVKLFKYPCVTEFAQYNSFSGHSSIVGNLRFAYDDRYLISIGAKDKGIFQWKVANFGPEETKEINEDGFDIKDFESLKANHIKNVIEAPKQAEESGGLFEIEDMGDGDQYSAVKPYEIEVKKLIPTGFKPESKHNDPPEDNIYIKHTFGYRCQDAKDSAKFSVKSDDIIFINAALGIHMNIVSKDQTMFDKHDDDIVSMDVTRDKLYCATGSMPNLLKKKDATIYVWSVKERVELACLKGFHKVAVKIVKFSPSGEILLSIGKDKDNSLALYDWKNERLICISKIDKEHVLDADWMDNNTFVTIGKHIKFWRIKMNNVSAVKGIWGMDEAELLYCCKYVGKKCFTGSAQGNICCWNEGVKRKNVKAHDGSVYCFVYDEKGEILYSGGKDGIVKGWKVDKETVESCTLIFDYHKTLGRDVDIDIKSLDYQDSKLLIGTRNSELYVQDLKGKLLDESSLEVVMLGHYGDEVWGLACHPRDSLFVTTGGDKSVRIWNSVEKTIEHFSFHSEEARAVDWSPSGDRIVIADVTGNIILYDSQLEFLAEYKSVFNKGKKDNWIEDIKYSPNNQMIAYGAHGLPSPIEILQVDERNNTITKYALVNGVMNSSLLHLDWSLDSNFIVINSEVYELKIIDIRQQKTIKSQEAKDIRWATWTCKLGFPVQGIFPGSDGSEVNTVCKSFNNKVMATGDDYEYVNLFRYPSTEAKSGYKRYAGHSAPVTRVRFCMNDNCLVTVGGADQAVIIWATDFGGPHEKKLEFFKGMDIDFEKIAELKALKTKPVLDQFGNPIQNNVKSKALVEYDQSGFMIEEVDDGDEFAVVKPWLSVIKPPSSFIKPPDHYDQLPNVNLTLEHCYGYRAK